jgi:hypothetical protein
VHHFGTAIGTMNFLRNLFTTMVVAVFGAIVLKGGAAGPIAGGPANSIAIDQAAAAFSRVFFAAAISMTVAAVALFLLAEKPLQTNVPPQRR